MPPSEPFKVQVDISPALDPANPSPAIDMLSEAQARFGRLVRQLEAGDPYLLGVHLRVTHLVTDRRREHLKKLVVVEALSEEGERFLLEWLPRLSAFEAAARFRPWGEGDELDVVWIDEPCEEERGDWD